MQGEFSIKPLFGPWLFISAGKHCCLQRNLSKILSFPFFDLEADRITFSRPLPTFLYFAVNTLSWIKWEIAKKLNFFQSCIIFGWCFYSVFRCNHLFLNSIVRWLQILREQISDLAELDNIFADLVFLLSLALFCSTSNVQKRNDVYKHRSCCHFIDQRFFLKYSGVWREPFIVL